ncbi:hypothetical protein JTB14_006849 [Gonioctena quinquepunctata]|nr:hypothetical protein JTB14_006849 [Gonioctena quinquepunctata]
MDKKWTHTRNKSFTFLILIISVSAVQSCETDQEVRDESVLDRELKNYVDRVFSVEEFSIVPGIRIEGVGNSSGTNVNVTNGCESGRGAASVSDYVEEKLDRFTETHTLTVNFDETARFLSSTPAADATASAATAAAAADAGKSTFLTGFGMGFLAFGLKKLLLPFFIGAQLLKSVLIAMFLPSILGGLGKFVGKGLSTFSGISGASAGNNRPPEMEDFEFKDVDPYSNDPGLGGDFNSQAEATNQLSAVDIGTMPANSRFGLANHRISYVTPSNDNYYMRRPDKKTDYKVFHKIPSSSMLLTSYDPFYSPLLSRLDAVFQQLGLGNHKSPESEKCRERLVCLMYANPAKYAPYSNLVSAQLSRELDELRKPSSDNPDILRFFRYMKAAKDGQDGDECQAHGGCPSLSAGKPSPAMLTTFNDINKLVLARKFN